MAQSLILHHVTDPLDMDGDKVNTVLVDMQRMLE